MAATPSFWQKLQSHFYPVSIRKSSSALNPVLELFYYRRRFILAAKDAVYSDGDKYRPLLAAFGDAMLKPQLARIQQVLVLGTGLASIAHILHSQGFRPKVTLVEIDQLVLEWAMEFLPAGAAEKMTPVCADAFQFIADEAAMYDLIIVDLFFGRDVPPQVLEPEFLARCKARMALRGFLILNYMVNRTEDEGKAKAALEAAFSSAKEISFGINKVYIVAQGGR